MWPFSAKSLPMSDAARRTLSKYVSQSGLVALESGKSALGPARIEVVFLLLEIPEDEIDAENEHLKTIFSTTKDHGGMIAAIMCPFLLVVFGLHGGANLSDEFSQAQSAMKELVSILGANVKAVTGRTRCLYGLLGDEKTGELGFLLDDLGSAFKVLNRLDFGRATEVSR